MRWFDVLFYYLFPATPTKPASEKTLNFLNFSQFISLVKGTCYACLFYRHWTPLAFECTKLQQLQATRCRKCTIHTRPYKKWDSKKIFLSLLDLQDGKFNEPLMGAIKCYTCKGRQYLRLILFFFAINFVIEQTW